MPTPPKPQKLLSLGPEIKDPEEEELELLSEQVFLRTLQVACNLNKDRHRALFATAQAFGCLVGVMFANRGHAKLASDLSIEIRRFTDEMVSLPQDQREAVLKRAFDTLNAESQEGKPH